MANRLGLESSPYLRQHADNPVDWWPWGADAFAEAKRAGKPIFVSIGYAACHWCHVMAHESFEHEATAKVMNELFINIKVDREERPDVDAIYMNAIMVQGEGGGWPLSAFCLPDGRPYFLGTYFPREPRFGKPTFIDLLRAMADAYARRRADAEENAAALLDGLRKVDAHFRRGASKSDRSRLSASLVIAAAQQLAERCDSKYGGLGDAPKFPSSSSHDLLARASRLGFGDAAHAAFDKWAMGMAEGGIYDHIGGGFARYSVDAKWLVPHFEKMLYDQAQLLGIYASAVELGGASAERARSVIAETTEFLLRELSDANGGLWSSLDADSEGEEGKYYVWTPEQVRAAIGASGAMLLNHAYGVTVGGNFEHGTSILSRLTARQSAGEEQHLAELREQLRIARDARIRPGTDDKVLAGWNGLAITGLCAAWRATGHAPCLALAERIAGFLRERIVQRDRIARVFHHGKTKELDGTLDDYAFCAAAFLDLAEATEQASWWQLGTTLLTTVRNRFVADNDGALVFYMAPADEKLLIHRPESHQDGAIPSGAAIATHAMLRVGLVAGDDAALRCGERYLAERLTGSSDINAWSNSALLAALDYYLHNQILVVTAGEGRAELLTAARRCYAPTLSIAGAWAAPSIVDGKSPTNGKARAYICTGTKCSAPVASADELRTLLRTSPS